MNKTIIYSGLLALFVSLTCIGVFSYFNSSGKSVTVEHVNRLPSAATNYIPSVDGTPLDFTETAAKVVDAVVHIKSTQTRSNPQTLQQIPAPFRDFFGDEFFRNNPESRPQVGSGSGVLFNSDGYIVTNNHVIDNASDIEVILHDNRTYKATVVGADPNTDLAVIQIKEENLPYLPFVNSDEVKVGQWVLAVGNPFSLNSTVTAGIVSAKGRSINILRERFAVESFIQTDAAINPGNSGGALVNLAGGLVGINTAIASPTGSYSGYGFAVPSNIVSKVVEDLLEFGQVQRGILGVMIRSVDGNLAREKSLALNAGVFVDSLLENSAAGEAGVKPGDVIIAAEGMPTRTASKLQEVIALRRPGDEISLKVNRDGKELDFAVELNSSLGTKIVATRDKGELSSRLGAELQTLPEDVAQKLNIKGGVRVTQLFAGKLRRETNMRQGFIITKVDGRPVTSVEDVEKLLKNKTGGVMLEGIYEDQPGQHYYAFGLS